MESPTAEFQFPESSVNISSAVEVLKRAEQGEATREEINETIGTLRDLQNQGITEQALQIAITRLIAARGE
ncbi:MAG: hypothetical protein A2845_04175 [Candidatus Lloydbacteria bacterium RIFCSPHIGHO2_01_FULL_49_22]|uniref:Uncharacterized protein n=1 Tax=Candidatus Lloydbacteria bacterium RIFCSPHIGHO2_01_FULL_49_22 TaxID=1798658 RepID=A0A1G2CW28_9BACT|nr:MAG: hypothetical protein A2845_04175 [Candidatus Lloydbacteria bacterium RIFCSPHIGHO2_01_FULL_49_22]OGZ09556.1 MAG: hypothetical protein A3C14_00520 [Candidatus Lloydbacteria bacterium RIFCSPHIGHO2_02_FULL_50_18]